MPNGATESFSRYLEDFPSQVQKLLREVRTTIKAAAPHAEETFSYGMPAFVVDGKALVWFGGFKSHIGFYPGAGAIEACKGELSGYKTAKGSIQFPIDAPIPTSLIERMVRHRCGSGEKQR